MSRLKISLALFFSIQIMGIIGFMALEQLSFLDAVYMTVTTMTTVGYGDITPKTTAGKIFDIGLIITGVGVAYYTFSLIIGMSVEGQLKNLLGRKGMNRKIAALKDHVIVCGTGKVGINAIEQLEREGKAFVIIDSDYETYEKMLEGKKLAVHGDATLDEVLLNAGLLTASGVITALPNDAENVYVTLTAKSLNPSIIVVARADRQEAEEKLRRAGADTVIFPSVMGGRQMVTAMLKPDILHLMENMFYNEELHMDITQMTIQDDSSFVGKNLIENAIKNRFHALIVAIKRKGGLITTPGAAEVLQAEDILIVIGERDALQEMGALARGE
ncbi:MAG: potassium channel protein [Sporomusaceae bacterium]|nr:potassium channel protein [Sporomusaceae bacterium]